ncbi:MAG: hypothetical protein JWQ27_345 [Ferruginibacter sp.]|nr:hypothetical protein [Ferruginibacter sp.]
MRKVIINYGLIAGVVVSLIMVLSIGHIDDFNIGLVVGYASMLIAFSFVFIGIKNYRDKYNGGLISFGKAFKIGLGIVLIASTLYVISWLINYYFFIPDYLDKFAARSLKELSASGASQAEIDSQAKEMADFGKMYKNPFFNAMMTYVEILPVGLIVTLISALILKRKTPVALPVSE